MINAPAEIQKSFEDFEKVVSEFTFPKCLASRKKIMQLQKEFDQMLFIQHSRDWVNLNDMEIFFCIHDTHLEQRILLIDKSKLWNIKKQRRMLH